MWMLQVLKRNKLYILLAFVLVILASMFISGHSSKEIGEVSTRFNMFSANDTIVVESFDDPTIPGISCYLSRAKTGGVTGMVGVAEDGSDAAISCVKTGKLSLSEKITSGKTDGDKVFSKSTSVLFKSVQVVRFYDTNRDILTYMAYSDKLLEGSPNNSISAVFADSK